METMTDTPETDSDESLRAIKWARDHAEELEKFHRREGEYYAEIPRSADFYANAESYARIKRVLTTILGQNMEDDHEKELTELRDQLREEQRLRVQTLNERDEARQWESQALVARIQRDEFSKTLGEIREMLCDAMPNENAPTSFMAATLVKERDEAQKQLLNLWKP
jgi:hypothetical protein